MQQNATGTVTVGNTVSQSQGTLVEDNKMEEYVLSFL